jgi:hypothetical protein
MSLIAISDATAREVQVHILGCESCTEEARIPLCGLLDRVTGRTGSSTDYVLSEPLRCPWCAARITEETLIESD